LIENRQKSVVSKRNCLFFHICIHYRFEEIQNHPRYEEIPQHREKRFALLIGVRFIQLFFSYLQIAMEGFSYTFTKESQPTYQDVQSLFSEDSDDEEHLNVNFDNCFSDDASREESFKRDSKVTAGDACQIKERVRN
jgi:hypothetical protein